MAGSAIDLREAQAAPNAGAILCAWYPGALGGKAVAQILFGETSPSGKLPVTFYNSAQDLPDFTDYSMTGRTYRYYRGDTLYPFGYGLTYGDVCVKTARYDEKTHELEITVANEGNMTVKDVIQVYIKAQSEFAPPNPRLCAFTKAEFAAGKSVTLRLPLSDEAFEVVDETGKRVFGGPRFELYIGTGQPDERTTRLTGRRSIKLEVINK
jgi:beta-glucosidase